MTRKTILPLTIIILTALIFTACGQAASPTPSIDQAVQTALAGTAAFNTAVGQAVQATITALPPTPTMPAEPDAYELSEEELAALIDQAVNEAVAATEASYEATANTTGDGSVSDDEIYETIPYVYDAEVAVAYAEELIGLYYDLYGDYASEALDLLYLIEEDLGSMSGDLEEIEQILVSGAEAATAAIAQLDAAIQQANQHVETIQGQARDWTGKFQGSLDGRADQFASLPPTQVAGDRNGAILQVYDYLDTVKAALGDKKISFDEMNKIAQLGANAQASIQAQGGPGLQSLLGSIGGMTNQLSRGQWPQARGNLGGFEKSLPTRPRR